MHGGAASAKSSLIHPVFSMTVKIKKAAHSGKSIKLTVAEVEILMRDEIYLAITRLEAEEMRKACASDADNDNSSVASGYGSATTPELGASVGLSEDETDAMSRGARLRLSEAISEVRRLKKP